jgi:hypothetical protein
MFFYHLFNETLVSMADVVYTSPATAAATVIAPVATGASTTPAVTPEVEVPVVTASA